MVEGLTYEERQLIADAISAALEKLGVKTESSASCVWTSAELDTFSGARKLSFECIISEMKIKSRLQRLLERNAHTVGGLSGAERHEAAILIWEAEEGDEDCRACKTSCPEDIRKSIYDTGLCEGHAFYALATRK